MMRKLRAGRRGNLYIYRARDIIYEEEGIYIYIHIKREREREGQVAVVNSVDLETGWSRSPTKEAHTSINSFYLSIFHLTYTLQTNTTWSLEDKKLGQILNFHMLHILSEYNKRKKNVIRKDYKLVVSRQKENSYVILNETFIPNDAIIYL